MCLITREYHITDIDTQKTVSRKIRFFCMFPLTVLQSLLLLCTMCRCMRSMVSSQPCVAVTNQLHPLNITLAGHYTPQCDANRGTFHPYQCHPSTGYCWCVNTRTGQAISGFYPRGIQPNCTSEMLP